MMMMMMKVDAILMATVTDRTVADTIFSYTNLLHCSTQKVLYHACIV